MENKKTKKQENKKNTSKWVEEKESKFENVKKEFDSRTHEKGFRVIVKDIETGDILMNEAVSAFVGGWAKKTKDGAVGASTLISACGTATLISAIESAEEAVKEAKKNVVDGCMKNPDIASLVLSGLVSDLFGGKR